MKNKYSIYTIAILFSIAIIGMVSCSKDDEQNKMKEAGIITKFTVSENNVESVIINFNQGFKMNKDGFKSGGDLLLGEALWLTEASVNYEFREEKEFIKDMESTIFNTSIPVTLNSNNEYMVTEDDVYLVYDALLAFATNQLGENEVLVVSDVEIGAIANDEADLTMTVVSGTRMVNPYSINETDYWYAVFEAGKCGDYSGQEIGKDASWRINQVLNAAQYMASYWTDIVNTEEIDPFDGVHETYLWYGLTNECLCPDDMSYWRIKAQEVVALEAPSSSHHRIEVIFKWDYIYSSPGQWFHYFENIRYGIPHISLPPDNQD